MSDPFEKLDAMFKKLSSKVNYVSTSSRSDELWSHVLIEIDKTEEKAEKYDKGICSTIDICPNLEEAQRKLKSGIKRIKEICERYKIPTLTKEFLWEIQSILEEEEAKPS